MIFKCPVFSLKRVLRVSENFLFPDIAIFKNLIYNTEKAEKEGMMRIEGKFMKEMEDFVKTLKGIEVKTVGNTLRISQNGIEAVIEVFSPDKNLKFKAREMALKVRAYASLVESILKIEEDPCITLKNAREKGESYIAFYKVPSGVEGVGDDYYYRVEKIMDVVNVYVDLETGSERAVEILERAKKMVNLFKNSTIE